MILSYYGFCLGVVLGFTIPINIFVSGLHIGHAWTIIVNYHDRIGSNCKANANVNIGNNVSVNGLEEDLVSQIGDNVYIGLGAKLFGKILVGESLAIYKRVNAKPLSIDTESDPRRMQLYRYL